jgi:N-sulfoglucosamine sulfohydrolase
MNRRRFIKNLSLGLGAAGMAARPVGIASQTLPAARKPGSQPNLVVLISDDQSYPDAGCYGNQELHTPNIDSLAREGLRFDRAFAASPSCSPSRSAILTGMPPHETGTSRFASPMPAGQKTILDYLQSAGYFTAAFKKVHQGEAFWKRWDFKGKNRPFEGFFERRSKDRPFFLHVGFHDPHRPYLPGERYPVKNARAAVKVPAFLPDSPGVRKDLAHYYEAIERLDLRVGKVLRLLKEHGLVENTLVIFTSDQGMAFPGAKGTLYDPGLHVPLLARWPGKIQPGRTTSDLVSLIDLAPTWLDAAGISAPQGMRGKSFLPLLLGKPFEPQQAIYAERNYHTHLDLIRCVRTDRYKLIRNYLPELPYRPLSDIARSPSWRSIEAWRHSGRLSPELYRRYFALPRLEVEFYDLENDPPEMKNLANDPAYAAEVRSLEELLGRWMTETRDFLPSPLPPAEEENSND